MGVSEQLIIFEGPDGAGKTTAARQLSDYLGAVYAPMGSFPGLGDEYLARFFAEAMMPAVLGLRPVVMDRCWLSEPIYGRVFRSGANRVTLAQRLQLERLAARCRCRVILCLPPVEACVDVFESRKDEELLDNSDQLREVYSLYANQLETNLPVITYDRVERPMGPLANFIKGASKATRPHWIGAQSAGWLDGQVLLVGDQFSPGYDPLSSYYRWPFGSLGPSGSSRWFTYQLHEAGIDERRLCWVNADQVPTREAWLSVAGNTEGTDHRFQTVIALGVEAAKQLSILKVEHSQHQHPQYHRRFRFGEPYELLKELSP